jgi:hypothetical protein
MIALCAMLCGGQGAVDTAVFAKPKKNFLRGFLRLANCLPSHDTFSRLCRQQPSLLKLTIKGLAVAQGPATESVTADQP